MEWLQALPNSHPQRSLTAPSPRNAAPTGPIEVRDRDDCAIRDYCPLCLNETGCNARYANSTLTFAKHYTVFIKNNIYFPYYEVKCNNTFPDFATEQRAMGYDTCVWGRERGNASDGAGNTVAVLPDCPFFAVETMLAEDGWTFAELMHEGAVFTVR